MTVYLVYTVSTGDRFEFEDASSSTIFASLSDAEAYKADLESESRWKSDRFVIAVKTIN